MVIQSGSVAGLLFMMLCPDELFGKPISFPYPWVVCGILVCAVCSSFWLGLSGAQERMRNGLLLILGAFLCGCLLAHG
jgi:hypothetical protein